MKVVVIAPVPREPCTAPAAPASDSISTTLTWFPKMFFRAAALNLRRGGLLLFDFNTIYKHEKVLADNVFVYDLDDVYCVWQNEFNPEDKGVDISLNIFAEAEDGLYERMEENFREITMPSEQVEKLLSESGFEVLEVREYLTNREPGAQSDKLMFCARKK